MDEKKGEAILPEEPQTETAAEESPKGFTRRQVVAGGIGVGLVGLIAGGSIGEMGRHRRHYRERSHGRERYTD